MNLEVATCPVCSGEGIFAFSQRDLLCGLDGEFGQRACDDCGTMFLSPRVPEAEVGRYYPATYGPYQALQHGKLVVRIATLFGLPFRRRKIVERFVRGGRILDVGCGSGTFLSTLQNDHWQKYAADLDRHLPLEAPVEFHKARFDADPLALPPLDAITLWHVFEHLYHPRIALQQAAKLLKPDGYLFLAIPDLKNADRRLFGACWVGWDVPRHVATYSKEGMSRLIAESGMRLVDIVPDNCTGDFMAMNFEFLLRSHGYQWNVQRSMAMRLLCATWAFVTVRMGLAPAKVYVVRK